MSVIALAAHLAQIRERNVGQVQQPEGGGFFEKGLGMGSAVFFHWFEVRGGGGVGLHGKISKRNLGGLCEV